MLTPIDNHEELALERLREQYKDRPKLQAFIRSMVSEIQELEDAFQALAVERGLDEAEGLQLDNLGDIVGLDRITGESDDDYRVRLRAKIAQNISQGEPEAVMTLMALLVGASMVVLTEGEFASIQLGADEPIPDQDRVNAIYRQIKLAMPAAVRIDWLAYFDGEDSFAFAGTTPGAGFGDSTDPDVGGGLATLYKDTNFEFAFAGNDPKGGGYGSTKDPLVGGVFI